MNVNGISSGSFPIGQNMSASQGDSSKIEALRKRLQQLSKEKESAVQTGDIEKVEKLEKQIQEIRKQIERLEKQEAKKEKDARKKEDGNSASQKHIDDYA